MRNRDQITAAAKASMKAGPNDVMAGNELLELILEVQLDVRDLAIETANAISKISQSKML